MLEGSIGRKQKPISFGKPTDHGPLNKLVAFAVIIRTGQVHVHEGRG